MDMDMDMDMGMGMDTGVGQVCDSLDLTQRERRRARSGL